MKSKKKIEIKSTKQSFEHFVNREDINILQIDVKACEPSYRLQHCFIAAIYYEDKAAPQEESEKPKQPTTDK